MGKKLGYEFVPCADTSGVSCLDSVWGFSYNTSIADEPWYDDTGDLNREETSPDWALNVEDIANDGDPRNKSEVIDWKDGQTFTLTKDCNSAFQSRLDEIFDATDDEKKSFLNGGLNVRQVRYYGNGAYVEKIWTCVTIEEMTPPSRVQEASDAVYEFKVNFNNEPEVINVGFTSTLPSKIATPTATVNVTNTDLTVTVEVANLEDVDGIIDNDGLVVSLYDELGLLVSENVDTVANSPITVVTPSAATYKVVTSVILHQEDDSKQLLALDVSEVTTTEAP